ncbi:hypothetical protein ES705_33885 [subsurface metagenome]
MKDNVERQKDLASSRQDTEEARARLNDHIQNGEQPIKAAIKGDPRVINIKSFFEPYARFLYDDDKIFVEILEEFFEAKGGRFQYDALYYGDLLVDRGVLKVIGKELKIKSEEITWGNVKKYIQEKTGFEFDVNRDYFNIRPRSLHNNPYPSGGQIIYDNYNNQFEGKEVMDHAFDSDEKKNLLKNLFFDYLTPSQIVLLETYSDELGLSWEDKADEKGILGKINQIKRI